MRGTFRRHITYKDKYLNVSMYAAIVRSYIDLCIYACIPYRREDIDKLERIQSRATK